MRLRRLIALLRKAFRSWAHTPPISSRHEIVLALAGASIMSGGVALFHPGARPTTILQFVPPAFLVIWYLVLFFGGLALIVSAFWRNRLDALQIEGPAYLLLGTGAMVYAICLIGAGHGSAFVAATGYLMYALAALARTARILLYLRWLGHLTPVASTDDA